MEETFFKFCRCGACEGTDKDLLDGQLFLNEQSEPENGDGIGFSGSCASLDGVSASEWLR
jgi:hypothetical protein